MQLLLERGANINAQGGEDFSNALEAAFCEGQYEMVQLLLDKGAVLNSQSLKKSLRIATIRKYDRVVQLLKDYEATLRREPPVSEGT